MRTISVLNHKGGVGKTTFTGCTAQALAIMGYRVLAIDNDSQHNLSTMLGVSVLTPGIRDVYRAPAADAPALLLRAIRQTGVPGLHMITSCRDLCDADVGDPADLKRALDACGLERYYDWVIVDNAPGMDRLQASAIGACDEIFVPTELKQFAVDGIVEMDTVLRERFSGGARISRIIPNFYRDTLRQRSFLAALRTLFAGRVTETAIPVDSVFDELITEGKTLFYHRLRSKGAAYYLKLVHELFALREEDVWDRMLGERNERLRDEARQRLQTQRTTGQGAIA
jgi:chromosome partitioning protein